MTSHYGFELGMRASTHTQRDVVVRVAVDDGERVEEAEAVEASDVVDQLRHGHHHLQVHAREAGALAVFEVVAHEQIHDDARLGARARQTTVAALQHLKQNDRIS